ncbi:MAG: formylglycine-generating enzyme family protein [Victivallales bacterium]|jgi:formylglycine-generating enzyme required for sulfatase activity
MSDELKGKNQTGPDDRSLPESRKDGEEPRDSLKKRKWFGNRGRWPKKLRLREPVGHSPFTISRNVQVSPLRKNMGRAALMLLALSCIVSLLFFHQHNIRKQAAFAKKISDIEKQIVQIGNALAGKKDYEKHEAVLKAMAWIDAAAEIDRGNPEKWSGLRSQYLKMLGDSLPVDGLNFVLPTAGIDMAFIPRGIFLMGKRNDENGKPDEIPRRAVSITYGFWMSRTEITNRQFREFYPSHSVERWKMNVIDGSSQPAVMLDWHMASYFCERLNEKELKAGRIPANYEYRLPTEAEWEYACRAASETIYYWGDSFSEPAAKFANSRDLKSSRTLNWQEEKDMAPDDGYLVSAPGASYKPNAFGLYDMTGNVSEWCWDWYNPAAYGEIPAVNPVQSKPVVSIIEMTASSGRRYTIESTGKVIRGGSWGNTPSECRSAARDATVPELKNTGIGFRIVLAPKISVKTASKKEASSGNN